MWIPQFCEWSRLEPFRGMKCWTTHSISISPLCTRGYLLLCTLHKRIPTWEKGMTNFNTLLSTLGSISLKMTRSLLISCSLTLVCQNSMPMVLLNEAWVHLLRSIHKKYENNLYMLIQGLFQHQKATTTRYNQICKYFSNHDQWDCRCFRKCSALKSWMRPSPLNNFQSHEKPLMSKTPRNDGL